MALTRDATFFTAFSSMADKSLAAIDHLKEMFEDPARAAELAEKIKDLEHEADHVTHEIVRVLHETWITPLDREEIHALITSLDDILDFIDAVSDKFALYEIKNSEPEALELLNTLRLAVSDIGKALEGLKNMKDPEPLLELCRSVNRHEHDADKIFRRAIARLFKETPDALEVMKWRDIYESLETATDRCEDVANVIEGIVLEHS
jgi:predicted phosphate transport protein (TIGR00153 family)